MKDLRGFFERLRVRRRPPTGPLTTAETTAAEELRRETVEKADERAESNRGEEKLAQ